MFGIFGFGEDRAVKHDSCVSREHQRVCRQRSVRLQCLVTGDAQNIVLRRFARVRRFIYFDVDKLVANGNLIKQLTSSWRTRGEIGGVEAGAAGSVTVIWVPRRHGPCTVKLFGNEHARQTMRQGQW